MRLRGDPSTSSPGAGAFGMSFISRLQRPRASSRSKVGSPHVRSCWRSWRRAGRAHRRAVDVQQVAQARDDSRLGRNAGGTPPDVTTHPRRAPPLLRSPPPIRRVKRPFRWPLPAQPAGIANPAPDGHTVTGRPAARPCCAPACPESTRRGRRRGRCSTTSCAPTSTGSSTRRPRRPTAPGCRVSSSASSRTSSGVGRSAGAFAA